MGVPFRLWGPHEAVCPYDYGAPIWRGDYISKLLVTNHFGLGDTIMMWRFVPKIISRVQEVIFRCDEELIPLFEPHVTSIISKEAEKPEFDAVIDMSAIPEILKINPEDVSGEPYLTPVGSPALDLNKFPQRKIGVCWKGNPFNPRDDTRSLKVEDFQFNVPDTAWFSLQKHVPAPDWLRDMRPFMSDFNETAHLVQQLDLVISVDTSIAHLAGALGTPVWVILTEPADMRWEQKGEVTGWYDSMKLFRKKRDTDELIFELCAALMQI